MQYGTRVRASGHDMGVYCTHSKEMQSVNFELLFSAVSLYCKHNVESSSSPRLDVQAQLKGEAINYVSPKQLPGKSECSLLVTSWKRSCEIF